MDVADNEHEPQPEQDQEALAQIHRDHQTLCAVLALHFDDLTLESEADDLLGSLYNELGVPIDDPTHHAFHAALDMLVWMIGLVAAYEQDDAFQTSQRVASYFARLVNDVPDDEGDIAYELEPSVWCDCDCECGGCACPRSEYDSDDEYNDDDDVDPGRPDDDIRPESDADGIA